MASKNIDTLRATLTKAQEEQDAAYRKYKQAEKRTKEAGRAVVATLAEGLDLTAAERRAMGLRKAP